MLNATEIKRSGDLLEAKADADKERADNKKKKEVGGRDGPDPTRYGDWEKNGRCIDF